MEGLRLPDGDGQRGVRGREGERDRRPENVREHRATHQASLHRPRTNILHAYGANYPCAYALAHTPLQMYIIGHSPRTPRWPPQHTKADGATIHAKYPLNEKLSACATMILVGFPVYRAADKRFAAKNCPMRGYPPPPPPTLTTSRGGGHIGRTWWW
jgi:hypothetical protein